MIKTICILIRTIGAAALLAVAAISVPAGDVRADAKCPTGSEHGLKCCTLNGKTYPANTTFTTNGKEFHCDGYEGSWIIVIEDEDLNPSPPLRPLLRRVPAALQSGGVVAP